MLWRGSCSSRSATRRSKSAFADHRTYVYKGKEVDQQVHLGFDLAVTRGIPIVAANRGKVLYADDLGIYGNCVIIDHGMGVQSLYGTCRRSTSRSGDDVEKEQTLGRSGMTGLAGGDHLHFTMLVNGQHGEPGRVVGPALDCRTASCASSRRRRAAALMTELIVQEPCDCDIHVRLCS